MSNDEYSKTTNQVRVSVKSFFLEDQSRPEDAHFVWAYRVRIENTGRQRATASRAGGDVRIHLGHPARHTIGLHDRRLSHDRAGFWREFRRRDPHLQSGQPAPGWPRALKAPALTAHC